MKTEFKNKKVSALKLTTKEYLEITEECFNDAVGSLTVEGFAKFLDVDKIVSIDRLGDVVFVTYEDKAEDMKRYYDIDKEFLIKDAEIRLEEHLGLDDPENYDANVTSFEETYGFNPTALCDKDSEHYVLEFLADEFAEKKDCNVADNATWENIISEELKNIKERGW